MENRQKLCLQIMGAMDQAYLYMHEYDMLPHKYGEDTLYQAESHIIEMIGRTPGITLTEIATYMNKTKSACSQIIRKLRTKEWVEQIRNEKNNREYNLHLTEHGWIIYRNHEKIDEICYQRAFERLSDFSDDDLSVYLRIQEQLNDSFRDDVEISKRDFKQIDQI